MTCGRQGGIHDEVYNLQRWTERLVRGRKIFRLSFGKWQMGDAPWQHYSGDFQNRASFLVQLSTDQGTDLQIGIPLVVNGHHLRQRHGTGA